MQDVQTCSIHISQVLAQMVKKWCEVLPEGVRQLEKFNRENNNVLIRTGEEKAEMLHLIKLKAFRGTASGQRLDLSVYRQVFEPINEEALNQVTTLCPKKGV